MMQKDREMRVAFFSSAEQMLLMELYKDIITKKGDTAAINKVRVMADRLNG